MKYLRFKNWLLMIPPVIILSIVNGCGIAPKQGEEKRILFDTDANNELDDQHALAYLFLMGTILI